MMLSASRKKSDFGLGEMTQNMKKRETETEMVSGGRSGLQLCNANTHVDRPFMDLEMRSFVIRFLQMGSIENE